MPRERVEQSKPKKGIVGYRDKATAVRWVSVGDANHGYERTEQRMTCNFGMTGMGKEWNDVFYANGEIKEGRELTVIEIRGPKKDLVNLMFEAAIKRIGFELE